MMNIKNDYLLLCWMLLLALPVFGQGWERHYQDITPANTEIRKIIADPSGGLLMLMSESDYNNGPINCYIQKTDDAGLVQWVKSFDWGNNETGTDLIPTANGGYAMVYESSNIGIKVGLAQLDPLFNVTSNQLLAPGSQYVNFWQPKLLFVQAEIHVLYAALDTTLNNGFGGGSWRQMETVVDLNGNVITDTSLYPFVNTQDALVAPNNDRVIMVRSSAGNQWGLMRFGNIEWYSFFSGPGITQYYYGGGLTNAPGGGFYACYAASGIPSISKIDDWGELLWQKAFPAHPDSLNMVGFIGMVPVADGSGYWATGQEAGNLSQPRLIVMRLDQQCNRLWSHAYGAGTFHNRYLSLKSMPDNGVVIGGSNGLWGNNFHSVAYRITSDGATFPSAVSGLVQRDTNSDCLGDLGTPNGGLEVTAWKNGAFYNATLANAQGGYLLPLDTGIYKITVEKPNQAWSFCTDTIPVSVVLNDTITSTNFVNYYNPTPFDSIFGYVFRDLDGDCIRDSFETQGYAGWEVQVSYSDGLRDTNMFIITDANGYFVVPSLPGFSNAGGGFVYPMEPQGNLLNCSFACYGEQGFNFSQGNSVQLNFGRTCDTLPPCPQMEVDIATNILRPCFNSNYFVNYCNTGLEAAVNAYVEVTIDTALQVTASSIPWTSVNGNVYTFDLGTVPSEFCNNFSITVLTPCDGVLGTTYCSSAHIYPDTACGPSNKPWDGSEVLVTAVCEGDSVVFTIQNVGIGAMADPLEYVVIEDNVLLMAIPGQFQLGAGEQTQVAFPANGHFLRMEANQSAGFPGLGNPVAWAEGCGGNGTVGLGFVNQYPLGDEDPWLDVFCRESTNSCDPNDKRGFPDGVNQEHFIDQNIEMEYFLRFQNVGTAPAIQIELRDTLPVQWLDPSTVRPGAASHAYEWDMQGNGVVVFRFPNINLPDSSTSEDLSRGFVKFRVSQRKDVPIGTVIQNDAAIYFDNNAPVITNETWHTVGEDYLSKTNVVFVPGIKITAMPNPAHDHVQVTLEGALPNEDKLQIVFRTVLGVPVLQQQFLAPSSNISLTGLPAGVYFYDISGEKGVVATGKVVVMSYKL